MPDPGTDRFNLLLAPHLPALFRAAYRFLRNKADAQDLVQDTCIVACERLSELAAVDRPLHWLLRVLHNRCIDLARRRKRAPFAPQKRTDALEPAASREPGPEDLLVQADGERRLERAFLELDDTYRLLLALRAEGYDLAEIETITGIAREVLRARLHRARRSLARSLAAHQDAPPTHAGSRP